MVETQRGKELERVAVGSEMAAQGPVQGGHWGSSQGGRVLTLPQAGPHCGQLLPKKIKPVSQLALSMFP